jgi:hypothetical protein
MQSHLKSLLKKIVMTSVVQESFSELMKINQIISEESIKKYDFLFDSLLLTIMDQIWIQEVYEPLSSDLIEALHCEIRRMHTP